MYDNNIIYYYFSNLFHLFTNMWMYWSTFLYFWFSLWFYFFMATSFHGIHVIIGMSFISVCILRQMNFHFSKIHHFGFETSAWYWHFVDVVWLFLYISIYLWGS